MDYRVDGSFKQRARNAERTTKQLKSVRRQKVGASTVEAIDDFEEHLKGVLEAQKEAIDDLPIDAEAGQVEVRPPRRTLLHDRTFGSLHDKSRGDADSDCSSLRRKPRGQLSRSQTENLHGTGHRSATSLRSKDHHSDEVPPPQPHHDLDHRFDLRPPSPLGIYDYGAISTRPRSMLAQRSKQAGQSMRPAHRQTTPGFYMPGADFRHGPYGFSMLDPIHMPNSSKCSREPPSRWNRDPADFRPATTEGNEHRHTRSRTAGPLISEGVKSAGGHDKRACLVFRALDKRTEESRLEQARFEHGVFDGRWRDPLLDAQTAACALQAPQPARCGFLSEEVGEEAPRAMRVASLVLFGVEEALRTNRSNLMSLFKRHNRGTVGVLEPKEFLKGLEKLGVFEEGHPDWSEETIIEAMAYIDPHFDGRVNFTCLERAVAAARGVQRQRTQENQRAMEKQEKKLTSSYHDSLPIDVVKVERQPKSLFNFERAFERFRQQQKELLNHHGEITQH